MRVSCRRYVDGHRQLSISRRKTRWVREDWRCQLPSHVPGCRCLAADYPGMDGISRSKGYIVWRCPLR
jgi:hypothetical protein